MVTYCVAMTIEVSVEADSPQDAVEIAITEIDKCHHIRVESREEEQDD